MKALHILSELQFSGAELMLHTAADHFRKHNVEMTILATGERVGIFAPYFEELGWKVEHIPFRKSLSYFRQLHALIRKGNFDVIHIHNEGALLYNVITSWVAGNTKIISTVHNNFQFSGYIKHRRTFHHFILQHLFRVKFTSISESVQKTEKEVYHTKTTLVNNWINLNNFGAHRDPKLLVPSFPTNLRLLSVGKCIPEKKHCDIIDVLHILHQRNISFHYVHIGCGPLEAEEKEQVKKLGLEPYVTFISSTDKVADYMTACNIYLMPSLFEGLSIACLEAMAAQLLCIVNDAPGLRTVITNEETGLVVDFSNATLVADKIEKISNDDQAMKKMTKKAADYVEAHHSPANADHIIALYN